MQYSTNVLKSRHGKKVESLPAAMLDEVMARVVTIFA
jgi:hypothetical protein